MLAIITNQVYLLGLISVFIIGGILRESGYFVHFYNMLVRYIKCKRAVLSSLCIVSGVLPVEGRCSVSAPILDSLVDKKSNGRKKMGLVDYVSTHHYYLWSPIEPSVMIFMSALGISWFTFIQATIIPLLIYFAFMFFILFHFVKEDDIDFKVIEGTEYKNPLIPLFLLLASIGLMLFDTKMFAFWYTFPFVAFILWSLSDLSIKEALGFIRWKVVLMVGIIIALGTIAKSFNSDILKIVQESGLTLIGLIGAGMLGAFFMGSSSKYAGLGAALVSIVGIAYLPIVIISEFIGYLLSPAHKCLAITKLYFDTPIITFYKFLLVLSLFLMTGGFVAYFI